jgi:hypothetical protein
MDLVTWLQIISYGLGIFGGIFIGLRWLIKHYLNELKPNHGTSLNDKIVLEILPLLKRLETRQDEIIEDITQVRITQARLDGKFENHLDECLP